MTARRIVIVVGLFIGLWFFGRSRVGIDKRDEHGMTALMYAAQSGNLAETERLIQRGADVNAKVPTRAMREFIAFISWMQQLPKSDVGYTPLMYAVEGGNEDAVALLLSNGANVNEGDRGGMTAASMAVLKGDLEAITLLADAGAELTPGHLMSAIGTSKPEMIQFLLNRGVDPNSTIAPQYRDQAIPPLLILAVQRTDAEVVKMLLDAGANSTVKDRNGWTPLRWAKHRNQEEIAQLLGSRGATDDQAGDEALIQAVRDGDAAAVEVALANGGTPNARDNRGVFALLLAARRGDAQSVEALLQAGAKVNVSSPYDGTPLIAAAENGHTAVVERLIAAGATVRHKEQVEHTALYQAIARGHTGTAAVLLKAGGDPNDGSLPLAALRGDQESINALIDAGADVRAQGVHALSEAARAGKDAAILLLLERGASPRVRSDADSSPLHRAASNCGPDVVKAMLTRGADPNKTELNGWTPLSAAAGAGKLENVRVLIAAGANVNARDDEGKSVLDAAARHPDVQDELRKSGAR